MEGLTFQDLIAMGGDTPLLVLIAYFLWKQNKDFIVLATQIKTFMGMHTDDDGE